MRRIRLDIEYDGTHFCGWQRQKDQRTVQEELEGAVARMTGAFSCLRGAGRTDSGVHARGQVAHLESATRIPALGLARGLRLHLPADVSVVAATDVDASFDARRSARGKRYCYRVWNREARSPLHGRWSWHVVHSLDVDAMRAAAGDLVGEHDFSAFRAADCTGRNPVRTIRRLDVAWERPGLLAIDVEGTAFLKQMCRVIAGTLVEVGRGARPPSELASILAGRDRARAGRTAPAQGLTLEEVFYEGAPVVGTEEDE